MGEFWDEVWRFDGEVDSVAAKLLRHAMTLVVGMETWKKRRPCERCGLPMPWILAALAGRWYHDVCPQDWMVTDERGERARRVTAGTATHAAYLWADIERPWDTETIGGGHEAIMVVCAPAMGPARAVRVTLDLHVTYDVEEIG